MDGEGGVGGGTPPTRRAWLDVTVVAAVSITVFLTSLGNGFAYDDVVIIRDNPVVHALGDQLRIWLLPYWPGAEALIRGLYRPFTTFLFAVQWKLGGGEPLIYHVTNVGLHALASVLVWRLLRAFVGRGPALAGALLFAVHPVHVEAVANAVGQAELVSAVAVLGAVVVWMGRPAGGDAGWGRPALVALLFLTGVAAKEHAIVLPALLLAVDVARGRTSTPGYGTRAVRAVVVLAGTAGVYLAVRWVVLGGVLSGDAAFGLGFLRDPSTRVLTALSVWPEYLRLLFFPLRLSAAYDPGVLPAAMEVGPRVLIGASLLAATGVAALLPRSWPGVGLGAAWFLATILPASNLVFPVGTVLGERLLYLPSVAVAIWAAFLVSGAARRLAAWGRSRRTAAVSAGLALLVALGVRSAVRSPVWADNEALFRETLRTHPESFRANWARAMELSRTGDTAAARFHWETAVALYDGDPGFMAAYGRFLLDTGRPRDAAWAARRALDLSPEYPPALMMAGLAEAALGNAVAARRWQAALDAAGFPGVSAALGDSISVRERGPR